MFTPIFIPDKNTHGLIIIVNPMSKKLNLSRFIDFYMFLQKFGKKNKPSRACPVRIEKSKPCGRNFTRGSLWIVFNCTVVMKG